MLSDMVSILTANPTNYRVCPGYRVCPKCVRTRPLTDFGAYKARLQSYCRECNKSYQKVWYKKAKARGKR